MIIYSIGFSGEEREELLALLKDNPKWYKRVKEASSCLVSDAIFKYGCDANGFVATNTPRAGYTLPLPEPKENKFSM